MKKTLALVLAMIMIASLFCGAAYADEAKPERTLILGSTTSEGTAEIEACHYFADRLYELSGGTLACEVLANGLAGSETEIVEGEQIGSVDMSVMCGVLQNFDPALMFLEWDFLFVNQDHLAEILYGEIGKQIEERILETTGIRVLDVFMRTPRLMTTTKKIESLADLNGLKIRVPEMAARTALWSALGASPTPMAFTEVYTALSTSTIEGQENPIATIVANKLYEVCPYLTISNHVYGFMYLNISDLTWQSLTAEQQAWVQQAADEAAEVNNKLAAEKEAEQLAEAAKYMEVTEVDTTDWREATKDVYKQFEGDPDYDTFESIYLAIVEAGKKYA